MSTTAIDLEHLMQWQVESTARLNISALHPSDAAAVFEVNHEGILEGLNSVDDIADLLAGPGCFFGGWMGWELVGVAYVYEDASGGLEIGCTMGSDYRRSGYAAELVDAVAAHIRSCMPECQVMWSV